MPMVQTNNPPCLTCAHDYGWHVMHGLQTGSFYCRVDGCDCVVYTKSAVDKNQLPLWK